MIDSHIHLSHKLYDHEFPYIYIEGDVYKINHGNRDTVLRAMMDAGITRCIEPAIDIASNESLLWLADRYKGYIYPAVGNHPTRCINSAVKDFRKIKNYALNNRNRIIAIGETGLDFHHERGEQHRFRQKIWFQYQISLSHRLNLPLLLHIRNAEKDAIRILRRNKKKLHGGICHCFNSGAAIAKIYTEELGLCLGIGGSILMNPEISKSLEESILSTPVKYLVLETDGPYVKPLKPDDISKKQWEKARNTSLILPSVAKRIAEIKGVSSETIIKASDENICRVFSLDLIE